MAFNLHKRRQLCKTIAALALAGGLGSCSTQKVAVAPAPAMPLATPPSLPGAAEDDNPPPAPREFRAAWVSTVANIDWPSRSNLSVAQQQGEILAILDRAGALHLNAIVLQVRPSADAIYPSKLEPWSEYLTGRQGQAPQPWYDPLKFWIEQAHARGLELHAWFNPYRARHSTAKTPLTREHIANTRPEAVKQYGKLLWMDPGDAAAAQLTLDVILDVVRRYDVDGIHIDDYFYPYPIDAALVPEAAAFDGGAVARSELEFPDQPSWQQYLLAGGLLERADWRRQNVNRLVEALYLGIHREKSWVRFGISPFGIGRPDRRPPGIAGFSQYDKLYADAELWLARGWLDYLSPQLYWPIAQAPQAFDVLLDYWLAQNPHGRHIWPGLFTSRIDNSARAFPAQEIVRQIAVTRSRPGVNGQVHFSMVALMENRKGISDQLKAGSYQNPALIPRSPWLGAVAPPAPGASARHDGHGFSVKLTATAGKLPSLYAIWSRHGALWRFSVVPAGRAEWLVADDVVAGPASAIVVSAVDRLGNESERVSLLRPPLARL